jgi:hypothetical protein
MVLRHSCRTLTVPGAVGGKRTEPLKRKSVKP